MIEA
jgi:YVTN family beta-propeller protein